MPNAHTFTPARGLSNPHAQTLWGALLRRPPQVQHQRERLWLADGDFLDLDWHASPHSDAPLALVLHGLTGSSNSHYVLGLQQQLQAHGWASVALNWRGCSGEPNHLPRAYHSGASDDLAEVIAHLRRCRPQAALHAVGYSLGGNVLLKYLGEQGEHAALQSATAISVPYRLDECANRIDRGFSRVYQQHFMRGLVRYVGDKKQLFAREGHRDHLATLEQLGSLKGLRTFWDFDGRFTAPLHGFSDAQDYYRRASSRYYLGGIRVPTLLIQALDDPFVFPHSLPQPHELAPGTQLELHARGGHVGFVGGTLWQPDYYLERRITQWLLSQHSQGSASLNL